MQGERHWLLVLVPLLLTLAAPLRWLFQTWVDQGNSLWFQPLVPLGVAYLIWAERDSLGHAYYSLAEVYPEGHKLRRGTPLVFYIGCIVLFFSYVTTVETFAVVGFLIAGIGAALYVYGFTILRGLWRPFLFAATMIPPPKIIVGLATAFADRGCAATAGAILHLFNGQASALGNSVSVGAYTVQVNGASSGVGVLFPVLVGTLFLCLLRQIRWTITLILLVSAGGIALLTNTFRLVLQALIGMGNPGLADSLHDVYAVVFAAVAFYLTYLLAGRIGPRRNIRYDDDEWEDEI